MSDGIFAFVQLDGSWGLNNTGLRRRTRRVLAVDACFTERRTRALLDALHQQAGERPVRTLVNTHHHGDHTFGNYLFLPEATIVGHERCRETISAKGSAHRACFAGVEWGEIELRRHGDVRGPPRSLGRRSQGRTASSSARRTRRTTSWPGSRNGRCCSPAMCCFNGGAPFALAGSVGGWLDALDRLRALGAEQSSRATARSAVRP